MTSSATTLLLASALLVALVGLVLLLRSRQPSTGPDQEAPVAPADAQADQTRLADGVSELLEATRSGGMVVGRDGRVLRATSSALTSRLVRGNDIVHPGLKELFAQVRADGHARERELESARGPLGEGRLMIGARVASISDGLILILVEDRTQARRVEQVRRDFVVNVSHELKTPVGGLSLLAEAVEGAADDPDAVRRFSRRMKVEADRLTRLVSEIVDLSRLQTTDLTTELVLVDVSSCADEAVDQTRLIAGERSVTARLASPREDLRVYGDPELITTAVRNLVTNAIAYSEDGTRVSVITRRVEDTVEVKVSDQGRGISASDQERIFERFYRVDPARSRMTGGTGLGLSIVKHICAGLGGEVTLWSQEGQGSTFTIRLPGVVDDDSPVGSQVPDHRRPVPRKVTI